MLVVWGQFAQSIGLIDQIQSVSLHQKTVEHSPQLKILEFLVAMLAGLEHLQDLSRSAHPIDQDRAVAKSWGQAGWADYSGVSRTLVGLTLEEAEPIAVVLEQISRPILAEEVRRALQSSGRLTYDGDLTARPVAKTPSCRWRQVASLRRRAVATSFQRRPTHASGGATRHYSTHHNATPTSCAESRRARSRRAAAHCAPPHDYARTHR
jgi:hypothetical protein